MFTSDFYDDRFGYRSDDDDDATSDFYGSHLMPHQPKVYKTFDKRYDPVHGIDLWYNGRQNYRYQDDHQGHLLYKKPGRLPGLEEVNPDLARFPELAYTRPGYYEGFSGKPEGFSGSQNHYNNNSFEGFGGPQNNCRSPGNPFRNAEEARLNAQALQNVGGMVSNARTRAIDFGKLEQYGEFRPQAKLPGDYYANDRQTKDIGHASNDYRERFSSSRKHGYKRRGAQTQETKGGDGVDQPRGSRHMPQPRAMSRADNSEEDYIKNEISAAGRGLPRKRGPMVKKLEKLVKDALSIVDAHMEDLRKILDHVRRARTAIIEDDHEEAKLFISTARKIVDKYKMAEEKSKLASAAEDVMDAVHSITNMSHTMNLLLILIFVFAIASTVYLIYKNQSKIASFFTRGMSISADSVPSTSSEEPFWLHRN